MRIRDFSKLLKETFHEWSNDNAASLAAGLAYYTVFAVGPLLVISIAVAGLVFGREAAQGEMLRQLQALLGRDGAEMVQGLILEASDPGTGTVAVLTGVATLIFGATGAFAALQGALNQIWEVQSRPRQGILAFFRTRFRSLAMVLGVGFLLLVSLVVSAGLAAVGRYSSGIVGGASGIWEVVNGVGSLAVITLLFAMIFKFLPDARIEWRDVWVGAATTAVLFTLGKFAIGYYLGNSKVTSGFGAAASLVIVLLWVYWSAQILFFGAEFAQVYAKRHGSWLGARVAEKVEPFAAPAPVAVYREEAKRARRARRAAKQPASPR